MYKSNFHCGYPAKVLSTLDYSQCFLLAVAALCFKNKEIIHRRCKLLQKMLHFAQTSING